MRVFVAGATGVIGRPLVDRLLAAGHDVTAMTRSPEKAAALRARGADAVVADALDAQATRAAVAAARPEVVVNELTDLPDAIDPRTYEEALAGTNRLRREATPTLAAAAREAGARRLISQSVSFMLRPDGPGVADEDAPLWVDPPRALASGVASTAALEQATVGADGIEGIVLRYGFFYGPGSTYAPDGHTSRELARRRFPIVGGGAGLTSFIHVDDAADATLLALDRGTLGIYNITDDEPVAAREWIPAMAAAGCPLRSFNMGVQGLTSAEHPEEPLYEDRFVCVVWRDARIAQGELSFERYVDAGHVVMVPAAVR